MTTSTLAATGTWTAAHALPAAASWYGQHDNAVRLKDSDKVLVVGGADGASAALNQTVLYNPANDTWSSAGTVATPRRLHAMIRLDDGKVLVTGGISGSSPTAPALSVAEVYDPAANSWTAAADMTVARWGHSMVLLPDNRVLVAGGTTIRAGQTTKALRSAELFDPATGEWTAAGDMTDARTGHPAVVLPGGKVLVCGGRTPVGAPDDPSLAFCELFDPDTDAWTPTGTMLQPRSGHRATLLSGGKVLVTGGTAPGAPGDGTFDPFSRRTAEVFDPATGTWTAAADMPAGRALHRAVAIGDGKVLVVGGTGGGNDEAGFRSAVIYDAAANTWTTAAGLTTGRWAFAAVALSDNRVLATGGVARSGLAAADPATRELTASTEIFTAGSGS
jgi:N-acetylneuraminic acid mutarotase